jgi:hypothetical protein
MMPSVWRRLRGEKSCTPRIACCKPAPIHIACLYLTAMSVMWVMLVSHCQLVEMQVLYARLASIILASGDVLCNIQKLEKITD